jgi:hypothetical protein
MNNQITAGQRGINDQIPGEGGMNDQLPGRSKMRKKPVRLNWHREQVTSKLTGMRAEHSRIRGAEIRAGYSQQTGPHTAQQIAQHVADTMPLATSGQVLAADRGGWRAGSKGLRVNESEVGVC